MGFALFIAVARYDRAQTAWRSFPVLTGSDGVDAWLRAPAAEGLAPLHTRLASAASDHGHVATTPFRYDLLRDAQELLALVAPFEQPPQRRRSVLQAMLHIDLVLELSRLHPA